MRTAMAATLREGAPSHKDFYDLIALIPALTPSASPASRRSLVRDTRIT